MASGCAGGVVAERGGFDGGVVVWRHNIAFPKSVDCRLRRPMLKLPRQFLDNESWIYTYIRTLHLIMTLISHSPRFLFIHVWKTGGTSIKTALTRYKDSHVSLTSLEQCRDIVFLSDQLKKHATALDIMQLFPEDFFRQYFKFAFVRNPWEIQVSYYFYVLQSECHFDHEHVKQLGSFAKYVDWRVNGHVSLQSDFICNKIGDTIVDFVGRFERMEADFRLICNTLGVSNIQLPKSNTSTHLSYTHYYDDVTRKQIGLAYAEDIERFSYCFG